MLAAIALSMALPADADAQRKRKRKGKGKPPAARAQNADKPKVFDFTGLELGGRMRTPQLLYFLDRATEELDRASLEQRSFIPEMTRTMEEEGL